MSKIDIEPSQKKYTVGFIQGTFDMFHTGHLNLINRAKLQCEKLKVGVIKRNEKKKIEMIGYKRVPSREGRSGNCCTRAFNKTCKKCTSGRNL